MTTIEPEKRCKKHHEAGIKLHLTPELFHYGKWTCAECDKFVIWAKNPKTCAENLERQEKLVKLALGETDPDKMKNLMYLYGLTRLNLVQQKKYDAL